MAKVQNFAEITPNLPFSEHDFYDLYRSTFESSELEKANLAYRKQRKHAKSRNRKMARRLLEPLGKILKEIRRMERGHEGEDKLLTDRQKDDINIITKMYRQQRNHFKSDDPRESVKDRIVNISKPHVRPIVRGKEVKSVEFGAKVNNMLVDGMSFIEQLSGGKSWLLT